MSEFEVKKEEMGTICFPKGTLMSSEAAEQFQAIVSEASKAENKNLILDFSGTNLIGSLIIGLLVRAQAHFDKEDGKIAFCNFTKPIEEVLTMTRVNTILNVYDSLEDARRIFN